MIVAGLVCAVLWAIACASAAPVSDARTSETDTFYTMPPALGVALFLALLLGIVLKRRSSNDED